MSKERSLRHDLEMLGANPLFVQSLDEADKGVNKVIDAAFKNAQESLQYEDILGDDSVLSSLEKQTGMKLYYSDDHREQLLVVNVKGKGFPDWEAVEKAVAKRVGVSSDEAHRQLARLDIDSIFWDGVANTLDMGTNEFGQQIQVAGRSGGYWGFKLDSEMLALDERKTKRKLRELYNTEEGRNYVRQAFTGGDDSEATPEEKGEILAEYFLKNGGSLYSWGDVLVVSPKWAELSTEFQKWVKEIIKDFESTQKWVDVIMDNEWVVKDDESQSRAKPEGTSSDKESGAAVTEELKLPEGVKKIPQRVGEILNAEVIHLPKPWRWSDENDAYVLLCNTTYGYPFTVIMGLFENGLAMGLFEGHNKTGNVSEMERLGEVPFQSYFSPYPTAIAVAQELKDAIEWMDEHVEPIDEAESLPEFEVEVDLKIDYEWEADETMQAELDYNGKGSLYLRQRGSSYDSARQRMWLSDMADQMNKSGKGHVEVEGAQFMVEAKDEEEAKKLAVAELKKAENWEATFTREGEYETGFLKVTVTDVQVDVGNVKNLGESVSMRGTTLSWICETCGSHVAISRRGVYMHEGKACHLCGRRPQTEEFQAIRHQLNEATRFSAPAYQEKYEKGDRVLVLLPSGREAEGVVTGVPSGQSKNVRVKVKGWPERDYDMAIIHHLKVGESVSEAGASPSQHTDEVSEAVIADAAEFLKAVMERLKGMVGRAVTVITDYDSVRGELRPDRKGWYAVDDNNKHTEFRPNDVAVIRDGTIRLKGTVHHAPVLEAAGRGIDGKITKLRPMTKDELKAEGWEDTPDYHIPLVIETSKGHKFYPSQDEEGNGPGVFWYVSWGKNGFHSPMRLGNDNRRMVVGKKITQIRKMGPVVAGVLGFGKQGAASLVLDDGSVIVPGRDDEGNDAGSMYGVIDGEQVMLGEADMERWGSTRRSSRWELGRMAQKGQKDEATSVEFNPSAWSWAENIADNYNQDVDTNLLSQMYDACNELSLDKGAMDRRWQGFTPGDKVTASDIYYLLTGGNHSMVEAAGTGKAPKFSVDLVTRKDQDANKLFNEVMQALDNEYKRIKAANPRGYMDEFESRFEDICMDIAQKMNATIAYRKDGTAVFNFSGMSVKIEAADDKELDTKALNKYHELRAEMGKIYSELRRSKRVEKEFGLDPKDPQSVSMIVMKWAGDEMLKRHPELTERVTWALNCSLGFGMLRREDKQDALDDIKAAYFKK